MEARRSAPVSEEVREGLAAAYAERLRLGLGSPFRLIHLALVDPRLSPGDRARIGRDLLDRVLRGRAYEIDPAALLSTLDPPGPEQIALARHHLALIEQAVHSTGDPRVGEMSVRLAYGLARLEGSVDAPTASAAVEAAALLRDRRVAQGDARRLVRVARGQDRNPLDLIEPWRRERLLRVEAPALQVLSPEVEREAIRLAPGILRVLRAGGAWVAAPPAGEPEPADGAALERLRALAEPGYLPPQAAVVVAVRWPVQGGERGRAVLRDPEWRRFAAGAWSEERFAVELPGLVARAPGTRVLAAKAALRAAVGLRPFAQERPWFPGDGGPDVAELRARHGVLVEIEPEVPQAWRPYLLRSLDEALAELRTVLPAVRVHGLRVRVTREPSREGALALHTPTNRVLEWPVTTGPGTLAHEIAHDLDWQEAHRGAVATRGYASDRAVARGRAPFAAALLRLTPERELRDARADRALTRPAEVLARNFDWFLVARLAAQGRWSGMLSSAQDEVLTGHGGVAPPSPDEAFGPAVLAAIRSVAGVPPEEKRAFLRTYGPGRWPTANLLVRSMEERMRGGAAASAAGAELAGPALRLGWIARARDAQLERLDAWLCEYPSPLVDPATVWAYRELVGQVAAARARAVAGRRAAEIAGEEGERWMLRELYGPLRPEGQVDAEAELELRALVAEVRSLEEGSAPPPESRFGVREAASRCAAPGRPLG